MERGDALEATRRRVELKKADAIAGPRTEQGRAAASAASQDWGRIASEFQESEVQIAKQELNRVNWGQALGGAGTADQVLGEMAQGLVREVAMARISETEARRGLDTIRETAAGVSARFVDQGARQHFDQAAGDLVRLVEDRINVQSTSSAPVRPPDTNTSGTAGGGTAAPARGEGGPGADRQADDRSPESTSDMDDNAKRTGQREQTGAASARVAEVVRGSPQSQAAPAKDAAAGTSVESSEEKLRERIERERAQDRDVER